MTAEQKANLSQVVSINPGILGGTPCFAGTRVPIQALLDHLEGGATIEDFLKGFPSVRRAQVTQFLELAKEQLVECASS